jgi:hypothetical protein
MVIFRVMEIERMGNPQRKRKSNAEKYCAQKLHKDKFFAVNRHQITNSLRDVKTETLVLA